MNIGIIPARLNSTRFPNKILENIDGLPMVVRVGKQVQQSNLDKVIVAVDDSEVYDIVQRHNIEVQMTSIKHQSGTDRVAEVAKQFDCVRCIEQGHNFKSAYYKHYLFVKPKLLIILLYSIHIIFVPFIFYLK